MKKKSVIYGCLILVFVFWMCSCGARKSTVDKSKYQTEIKTTDNSTIEKQSDTNIKETTTVKVDDKNQTITEETILEPSDNTKESFVIEKDGTKTILNNTKKTVRKTTKNNNTQTEIRKQLDSVKKAIVVEKKNIKEQYKSKKEIKSKKVDKKQFNPFQLFWLIIPVGIIYIAYRKYKKLPLVPKI